MKIDVNHIRNPVILLLSFASSDLIYFGFQHFRVADFRLIEEYRELAKENFMIQNLKAYILEILEISKDFAKQYISSSLPHGVYVKPYLENILVEVFAISNLL